MLLTSSSVDISLTKFPALTTYLRMNDHWKINLQMQEHGDEFVVIQSPLLSYQYSHLKKRKGGKMYISPHKTSIPAYLKLLIIFTVAFTIALPLVAIGLNPG